MKSGIKLLVKVQTTHLVNRIREGLFGNAINCHCLHIFSFFSAQLGEYGLCEEFRSSFSACS